MRIRQFTRMLIRSLPLAVALQVGATANAQFRELSSDSPSVKNGASANLPQTRQPFAAPRVKPVPQKANEPTPVTPPTAAQVSPSPMGTPTPAAIPSAALPQAPSVPSSAVVAPSVPTGTSAATAPNPMTPSPLPVGSAPASASALPAPAVTAPAATTTVTSTALPAVTPSMSAGPSAITTTPAPTATNPFALFHSPTTSVLPSPSLVTTAPQPEPMPQPLVFNQMVPGMSTMAQLEAAWGKPELTTQEDGTTRWIYRAPGFRQIDVVFEPTRATVETMIVHLNDPIAAELIGSHLGLTGIRPVTIEDEQGISLGRGFPERGVLLNWTTTPEQVTHIVLEPVSGELFRMRAEADRENHCERDLADLVQATKLNPEDAQAHWLHAELLSSVGRFDDAKSAAANAVRINGNHPLYKLTQARLAAENGELKQALLTTRAIAEAPSTPTLVRSRAEYQWGNLLALGPEPDFQESLNHHLKAIDIAAKFINQSDVTARRMAKDILIDSHLAVAQDIALGSFQRQREVVPKWLTRATELAEETLAKDQGDPTVRMEIYRTTLAIYSVLDGNFDPSVAAEEAIQEGQRLVAQASDRLYQQRVERELSESLYHAAKVEHRCGRMTTAMQYASNAVALADAGAAQRQPSLFDRIMSGQLYFLTGSLYAVTNDDHAEAVRWYEKSMPAFDDERLEELVDSTAFGDLFVSMGVSYWEVGQKERAVELTQGGAELMQQGVQAGIMEMTVLSVPYGNLAVMHEKLGNADKAKHFATMLAKVEGEAKTRR